MPAGGGTGVVEHKDVIQAILSASSALAGLVLVFLGIIVSFLQSLGEARPGVAPTMYRLIASAIGSTFFFGILTVALCVWWLAGNQNSLMRWLAVGMFILQLLLLVVSALWVLLLFVRKDPYR